MARFIYAGINPFDAAVKQASDPDFQVLTSSRLAARTLQDVLPSGTGRQSLGDEARKQIEGRGWKVASALTTQTVLRQVLQDVLPWPEVSGEAKAWTGIVIAILQSCKSLGAISVLLSERANLLVQVAQQYQQALHDQGLLDGSELFWRAMELAPSPRQVLIYGYFQPRQDELAWMNEIAAPNSVVYLPSNDHSLFTDIHGTIEWLKGQGWQVVDENTSPQTVGNELCQWFLKSEGSSSARHLVPLTTSTNPEQAAQEVPGARSVQAFSYGTFDAEVRGTLTQVKALLTQGIPARDIAIIARDEVAYGPHLIDGAWEYGVPLRALYNTPFLSTRLGGWLEQLLQVVAAGFPFESTARLLSHPLASNPDSGFWAVVRGRHPQGFAAWREVAQEQLKLDLTALGQVNQQRRRDTWVQWWQDLLRTFDLRRRCARWARESLAFNELSKGLVELSRPEDELLAWPEFRQQFQDLLDLLSVPAQPGRGGVELHRPTSVMGARYSHIFVIGMAEGTLPAPIHNDPVLDFFERQQLQGQGIPLPLAAEQARREALSFVHLLQTVTEQMTFSFSRLKDRQEQLPSPYLERLGLTAEAPDEKPVASPEELRRIILGHKHDAEDLVLRKARQAWEVEQSRESNAPADEYDGIVDIPFNYSDWTFSASQLTSLGQCPFRWFAQKVLQLGPPNEVEDELSPSLRGSLYHKVLELLISRVQEDQSLNLTDPELLRATFLDAETAVGLPELPAWEQRREEHLRCLELTIKQPTFWPEDAEPIALEHRFEGEWQGLKVKGCVDRIDRTAAGLVLIDYKTSSSAPKGIKDESGRACLDVQLPLYQAVAAPELSPDEPVADAYYYSLTKGKILKRCKPGVDAALVEAIERCKGHLDQGHYPVQPDTKREACRYCDFDVLCRQGDRLSRKEENHGTD